MAVYTKETITEITDNTSNTVAITSHFEVERRPNQTAFSSDRIAMMVASSRCFASPSSLFSIGRLRMNNEICSSGIS